jgi:Sulfate permease family
VRVDPFPVPLPIVMRLLPGLRSLSGYERRWLRADVLAGVTVAAYPVPQVMGYAELAGLPAVVAECDQGPGCGGAAVPVTKARTSRG